jgi:hypothetical protein
MSIIAGHEHVQYVMVIVCVSAAADVILSVVVYSETYSDGFPTWINS